MDEVRARRLELEGSVNFRDLGGYPAMAGETAWGLIYRSDGLLRNGLTPADLQLLADLGLRTVVDLRHASELELAPNAFAGHATVGYHHNPVNFDPVAVGAHLKPVVFDIAASNDEFLRNSSSTFACLFRLVADPGNLPLVFHCTSGRDRTGIASMLLLAAAGVPAEVIAADYVLSNEYLAKRQALAAERWREDGVDPATILEGIRLREEYAYALLETVEREFGGVDGYLAENGVTADELASFRSSFAIAKTPVA